jgi:hypothetical protein
VLVGDAAHLIADLLSRHDSRLQAKVAGWVRPISYEEMRLLDLLDFYRKKNFSQFSPSPRPWDRAKRTYGGRNKRAFTRDEIRAAFSTPMA